ncbi:uncharacterized protein HD556DRAFT_1436624 [Suillus plorans]|uniref:Uncharacterized protein n=1 Tax=Suillus plorans TaxID=116603 RepID=A0A9P7DZ14_9AGAM|nr:uncharacterized protein HD556DRAFT_1436624 [Suillus plorans]KAG1806683.1 hypothetical protein HD556DRAFT_1436624 [Suillus plorans]
MPCSSTYHPLVVSPESTPRPIGLSGLGEADLAKVEEAVKGVSTLHIGLTKMAEAQASEHTRDDTFRTPTHLCSFYPEELATRKEAHTFDQEIRAERARELRRYGHRSHNLTLDHRNSVSGPSFRSSHPNYYPRERLVHSHWPKPHTTAQVIAEVNSNAATILAPAPARIVPATDPGPDIEEIIAAAEQLDLKQASRMPDVTTKDIFSRLILIGILIVNVLTLVLLSAAFASIGPTRKN